MSRYRPGPGPARIVIFIVAVVIGAGIVYFGLQLFMDWHRQEVATAVRQEEEKSTAQRVELLKKIEMLSKDIELLKPVEPPREDGSTEVFGAAPPDESDCATLDRQARAFFTHLDRKNAEAAESPDPDDSEIPVPDNPEAVESGVPKSSPPDVSGSPENAGKVDSRATFIGLMGKLSGKPPLVIGETRDIPTLIRNQIHFARLLDADQFELVYKVLDTDREVIEQAMAVFYSYYVSGGCCKTEGECISLSTAYDYAGFFLNTLSGQSYLMRRESAVRGLTRYYSILVLDRANDQGLNRYGIDIRPHIDLAADEIGNLPDLRFKDRYIAELTRLREKYPD